MNDMELLDFMVRQYQTQTNMAKSLKLGDGAISNWKKAGKNDDGTRYCKIPSGWKNYFQAQFDKTNAVNQLAGFLN